VSENGKRQESEGNGQLSLLLNINTAVEHIANMPQQVTNDRLRRPRSTVFHDVDTFGFYKLLVVVCPKARAVMEKRKRLPKALLPYRSSDSLIGAYM